MVVINSCKKIYLADPSYNILTQLNGVNTSTVSYSIHSKDYQTLSFDVDRYIVLDDGTAIESSGYEDIGVYMYLYLEDIGFFQMQQPTISNDGVKEYKSIIAYSCEKEFEDKDIGIFKVNTGEDGSYERLDESNLDELGYAKNYITFYRSNDSGLTDYSLLHLILEYVPGWSVSDEDVDESLWYKKASFDEENINAYALLTSTIAPKFECIITFDIVNRKIGAIAKEHLVGSSVEVSLPDGTTKTVTYNNDYDTSIFVGFRNLANSVSITTDEDSVYTQFTCAGDDDLTFEDVNFGQSKVIDLSYFTCLPYMSEETATKVKEWQSWCDANRNVYMSLAKQWADIDSKKTEIEDRVPSDMDDWDQYSDMDTDLLNQNLEYYQALIESLQISVDTRPDDEKYTGSGDDKKYNPVKKDDGTVDNDYYLNLLKQMANGYGGYYTYFEIITYVIPNIEVALYNKGKTEANQKDYVTSYENNWDLYGITELQNKKTTYEMIISTLADYKLPYSESGTKVDEETYKKKYSEYWNASENLTALQPYLDALLKEQEELQAQLDNLQKTRNELEKQYLFSYTDDDGNTVYNYNLTEKEVKLINALIHNTDYTNSNIIKTSVDATVTTIDREKELFDDSVDKLSEVSQPQFKFSVELDNLLRIDEFKDWVNDCQLYKFIRLGIRDDYSVKVRIVGITYNPCEITSDITLEFSNMITSRSGRSDLTDILDSENNRASKNSISLGASTDYDVEFATTLLQTMIKTNLFEKGVSNVVGDIEISGTATIDEAQIRNLFTEYVEAGEINVGYISGEEADFEKFYAKYGILDSLVAEDVKATAAELGYLTVEQADVDYAKIDFANVADGIIDSALIKDGAIIDAKISSVSANKLSAGTIDASKIEVKNLNADNLTVGTINGKMIGNASVDLDKLSEEVPTKEYLDSVQNDLQNQIDGAIETFTIDAVPTLTNEPAVNWSDNVTKAKHVGDICYVLNEKLSENGYCYRFANTGTTDAPVYEWVLIKDSDVTKALQDLVDVQGDISGLKTFETETTKWKSETDSSLANTISRVTNVETDLGTKVDSTIFNEVKTSVDENKASITNLSTIVETKADGSTVDTLNKTVNEVKQTADSNSNSIRNLSKTVETKADGSTVDAIETRTTALETNLEGFQSTVSNTYVTKTTYNDKVKDLESDISTAQTTANTADTNANDALTKTSSLETRVNTAETNITQNKNDIALRATKTEVETAKSDAISTASTDATTKANNALSNAKSYADAQIKVSADSITSSVANTYATKEGLSSAESKIQQNADGIETKVSKDGVISAINQSAETVSINASKINLNGAVTANNYFKINTDGSMSATNGTFSGVVNATSGSFTGTVTATTLNSSSGKIGGWTIGSSALYNNTDSLTSTSVGTYIGTDGFRNYKDSETYVDIKDGILYARGANITGDITANHVTTGAITVDSLSQEVIDSFTSGDVSVDVVQEELEAINDVYTEESGYEESSGTIILGSSSSSTSENSEDNSSDNTSTIDDTTTVIETISTLTTETGETIYTSGFTTLSIHAKDDADGNIWGYYKYEKISLPKATFSIDNSNVPDGDGFIGYLLNDEDSLSSTPYIFSYVSGNGWAVISTDGSNVSYTEKLSYQYIIIGEFTKSFGANTYQLYTPWRSYYDIKARVQLGQWSYNNAVSESTTINGGLIQTHTIITNALATDAIKSLNYEDSSSDNFSSTGTFFDLSNGVIKSKNFAIDSNGNSYFSGKISASSGNIGGWTINNGALHDASGNVIGFYGDYYNEKSRGMYLGIDGIRFDGEYDSTVSSVRVNGEGINIYDFTDPSYLHIGAGNTLDGMLFCYNQHIGSSNFAKYYWDVEGLINTADVCTNDGYLSELWVAVNGLCRNVLGGNIEDIDWSKVVATSE